MAQVIISFFSLDSSSCTSELWSAGLKELVLCGVCETKSHFLWSRANSNTLGDADVSIFKSLNTWLSRNSQMRGRHSDQSKARCNWSWICNASCRKMTGVWLGCVDCHVYDVVIAVPHQHQFHSVIRYNCSRWLVGCFIIASMPYNLIWLASPTTTVRRSLVTRWFTRVGVSLQPQWRGYRLPCVVSDPHSHLMLQS